MKRVNAKDSLKSASYVTGILAGGSIYATLAEVVNPSATLSKEQDAFVSKTIREIVETGGSRGSSLSIAILTIFINGCQ